MVGRLRNLTLIGGLAVCAGLSSAAALAAQGEASGPIVRREVRHDRSPRLSDMKPLTSNHRRNGYDLEEEGLSILPPQGRVKASQSAAPNQPDSVVQTSVGPEVATTALLNFKGVSASGYVTPDANGALGATQYVQWVNTRFAVYSKTNRTILLGPVQGSTLWQGFGGACDPNANPGAGSNQGDIIAQYDKAARRWVMTHHANIPGNPYTQCVAVSTTSDATGTWNRYAFPLNLGSDLPDYPKLGVWSDAYYMSWNVEAVPGFQTLNVMVCALDRNAMLSGSSARPSVCFQTPNATYTSLLPSDLDGQTAPPTASPDYYLSLDPNWASLDMWKFHVDFAAPSNSKFTGPTNIPVAPFTPACSARSGVCIPQLGTTQLLDSLSDRLMYRLAYRNFGSHESLVVAHSVNPRTDAYAGIRWYEIRSPGTTPVVYQQGTYSPNDGTSRWLPSIAMDKVGDIAVGYSVSSSSIYPGIRYTGRVPTDALNTLEGESTIITGTGAETTGNYRWGDYSALAVDPIYDCTFWYTNEYYVTSGTKNWFTRIASFKFANCH